MIARTAVFAAMLLGALAVSAALRAETQNDANSSRVLSLSGADWRIHEDADGKGEERGMPTADANAPGWIPAAVPGNIQADLEAAHLLKPLWYGAGDPRMADVARKDWWYCKEFLVPESFKGERLTLVFDGVDHECDVWLNGRKIGRNAGMFRRFWFDVTAAIEPGRKNQVAVRVARIPEDLVSAIADSDAKVGLSVWKGTNATRLRLKELKSPTNCSWDWAVAIYTLGIWKDVRLEASGPARIEWVRVQTPLADNYLRATVKAQLEVESVAEMSAKAVFRVRRLNQLDVCATAAVDVALKKGHNKVQAELPLENPALWWPNGQGTQPLYELESTLTAADNTGGSAAGLLDRRETRFGVREVRWEQCPGAPADFINPLKLVVNGRPVRQMGSNILPPDCLFGRIDQRGPRLIELAQAAGINCLRVWGGGVVFSDKVYDRADALGIMLLEEFPLANDVPETDPVMLSNFESTITNIVKQTRNHPCIVEWTGGNEMPWQNGTLHPALQLMEKIMREEDGRIFRAAEPAQGSGGHGSYVYHTEPAPQLEWRGAGNLTLYQRYNTSQQMRISEFGTNSPANLEVWHREVPPSSQWPLTNYEDPVLIRKNVFWGAWLPQNWLHKEINERMFGPAEGLEQIVQGGQFLGAEGLRYAMDALRRKGKALGGGFMSWNYNEPWPNGAGSYMVDYDGRPLMNYDFVRQALAPVSLSLKYDSILYDPALGVKAGLWISSDAPAATGGLKWQWLARDCRGQVFGQDRGTTAIEPQEAKQLGMLELQPSAQTGLGPLLIEMQLHDAAGRLLVERLHVFGPATAKDPLGGLLRNAVPDDDAEPRAQAERANSQANLAFVGNGAKPATASAELPGLDIHRAKGLNDGAYGNAHSWIGGVAKASFKIELSQVAEIGRFRLGRDRSGAFQDRSLGELKIETSADDQTWKTVFEQNGLSALPGYQPSTTMEIRVAPVRAKWVRATVNQADVCLDEFEVYAPAKGQSATLPQIAFQEGRPEICHPVRRTSLRVKALPLRLEAGQQVLELQVQNTGAMTALFCEPHPLIEYRTDLFIDNNHCFIPPGESRTLTIKAADKPRGGLSLAATGWRITTWNADDLVVEPGSDVLLAVGRRDQMCREYLGYFDTIEAAPQTPETRNQRPDRKLDLTTTDSLIQDSSKIKNAGEITLAGTRPDPSPFPYLLDSNHALRCEFPLSEAQAKQAARLRIHTADQAEKSPTKVAITLNGRRMEKSLPLGLGIQRVDPAHLAFPATVEFEVPAADLRPGKNTLEVRVQDDGWFSWDALDITTNKSGASSDGR